MHHSPVWPGRAYPLGATVGPEGVNFALYSQHATGVDVCLFDSLEAPVESTKVRLLERTDAVWHGLLPGLRAGQLYGFRVHGPYRPSHGHRFNAAKVVLDPYARAVAGQFHWCDQMFGYPIHGDGERDLRKDLSDNAWAMPKCVVVDPSFDWGNDRSPGIPLADSIIYEVHVKGFSKLSPELPEHVRGTYAGLGSEWAIAYFKQLGITAVELLPIQQFVNDQFLEDKGLSNYWGYSPIGYFAPHPTYSSSGVTGGQVQEFKEMVKNLHAAGIEVILDVVYNHTGEGNHYGPTLSFRGIDNANYYWLSPEDRRFHMDFTGCGNSLNVIHPRVLQLIMDSLRYWVQEMHVDGFRFDLAATLGREVHGFDRGATLFDIVRQDPVLSQVKLIAEPWDLGLGGYQIGNFPAPFAEWNGKFRDCVRAYWKGDEGQIGEFAKRITGSSDLFQWDARPPSASINFITAHDGFTLADLVTYNEKHNEANGEGNRDGESHNRSWNCGVEGPSDDPEVQVLRRRQIRNFLATLLLSQGVPMLCGGDEYARSQQGNNNAYCQDNELSWFQWDRTEEQRLIERFVERLIAFRHAHPIFRRRRFFTGKKVRGAKAKDILWLDAGGREMTEEDWTSPHVRCIGVVFAGVSTEVRNARGEIVQDDTFLLLFNAHHDPVMFQLAGREAVRWERLIDTREEEGFLSPATMHAAGEEFEVEARSMCVFRLHEGSSEHARRESWKARDLRAEQEPAISD